MELYRFTRADVLEIVQVTHKDWNILSKDEQSLRSAELEFRDEKGEYWMVDMDSLDWYRNVQNKWVRSDSIPEGPFEGPFSISTRSIPLRKPRRSGKGASQPKSEIQSIEWVIRNVRDAYRDREITSTAAEVLAWGQHLVGKDGVAWTVGLQSGDWFSFVNKSWRKSSPPEMDMLTHYENILWCSSCKQVADGAQYCANCGGLLIPKLVEATDDAYSALIEYHTSGYRHLPEPVTDPWNPPDIPAPTVTETETSRTVICSNCATVLSSDSVFCTECGAKQTPVQTPKPVAARPSRISVIMRRISAPRMLFGLLLSVGVSALFPYLYYVAARVKLNPATSLAAVFILGLIIAFSFFAYSLKKRRASTRKIVALGERQPSAESEFCATCGTPIAADAHFCEKCGTPV